MLLLLLLLFYYWLLVSASKDHYQANIHKKKRKIPVHIVKNVNFMRLFYYMHRHFTFFCCKYWPDDCRLRPYQLAN